MKPLSILYHGSTNIIAEPMYGYGNLNNDYGQGFYCTEHPDVAREWACKDNTEGYLNEYTFDSNNLKVLQLNNSCDVLDWLSILLQNRHVTYYKDISAEASKYLRERCTLNLDEYDLIVGYRVDDRYFSMVRQFLNNRIGLETLTKCMSLGKLGEQIVLKSEGAFERIHFKRSSSVDPAIYCRLYRKRMDDANRRFEKYTSESSLKDERYIVDIMREDRQ